MKLKELNICEDDFDLFIELSPKEKIQFLFDASEFTAAITAGTEGAFVFLRNLTEGLTTTADVYIGHGASADLADSGGGEATRLMPLKPGEFSCFAYDLEADLITATHF